METLLELHTKYSDIIRETFVNDSEFLSALDKACAVIVNMKNENRLSTKAPELVSADEGEVKLIIFLVFSLRIIATVYCVNQRKQRVKVKSKKN